MAEEDHLVKVIVSSLAQAADQLHGAALFVDQAGKSNQVTVPEATELINTLAKIIHNNQNDAERIRVLLFEIDPRLIAVLLQVMDGPQLMVEGDPLAVLVSASCKCLSVIVGATLKIPGQGAPTSQAVSVEAAAAMSATEEYVGKLLVQSLVETRAIPCLCSLLAPAQPPDVNYAACDCLFAMLVRSGEIRAEAAKPELGVTKSLIAALSTNNAGSLRSCVAACLREVANNDSVKVRTEELERVLVRVLALDSTPDVRALCAETLDVIFKRDPAGWGSCAVRKELATACVDRLEREKAAEALEAVLKLIETLLVAESLLPESLDHVTFSESFTSIAGDRALVVCITLGGRVATLSARALRLLIQLAPFYRYVPFNLVSHFPTLSTILKLLIDLNRPESERAALAHERAADPILRQILRVELAMAFCMLLALDPRCRQLLASQLHDHPQWSQQLRAAVLSHLNAAALEYFADITLQDCTGEILNNVNSVTWETELRPTRTTVEETFEQQEERWVTATEGESHQRRHGTEGDLQGDAARMMRLTFILLSYAAHRTLQEATMGGLAKSPRGSPSGSPAGADANRPEPSKSESPSRHGPMPTRTSILREWGSRPERFQALQRAAANPDLIDTSAHRDPYEEAMRQQQKLKKKQMRGGNPNRKNALFTKFDAALKLCTSFAQYYNSVGDPIPVVYETTPDGFFARRQPKKAAYFNVSRAMKTKTWTLDTLREGDLFFFSVPLPALNSFALEQIRLRAIRHLQHVKKSFIITPQSAKDRRWFLFDMLNHIMPGVVHALTQLLELFQTHGDENVKFPIVMFRERELQESGGGHSMNELDDALHSGNLLEVLDQVLFYFQNYEKSRNNTMQGPAMSSQYLRDLEHKIKALSQQEFTGAEPDLAFALRGMKANEDRDGDESVVSDDEPVGRNVQATRGMGYRDDVSDVSDLSP